MLIAKVPPDASITIKFNERKEKNDSAAESMK